MTTIGFYGRLELPSDTFIFDDTTFYLSLDRKERIEQWAYETHDGRPCAELEALGTHLIGVTLQDAWVMSARFVGVGHAIYWQLGRLLGLWHADQPRVSHLICRCFGVDQAKIFEHLKNAPDDDSKDLTKATRAGAGCGSCKIEIEQLLQSYRDGHGLKIKGVARPMGLNPLEFLISLEKSRLAWQELKQESCRLRFLGVCGYNVFADWQQEDESQVQAFRLEHQKKTGVNWNLVKS
jgi:bacterioferritin-associated ferredoxin